MIRGEPVDFKRINYPLIFKDDPPKIILKFNKKCLQCGLEFQSGTECFLWAITSKRRIYIAFPYQGTYSIHLIKGGRGCLVENLKMKS